MPTSEDSGMLEFARVGPLLKVSARPRLRILASQIIARRGPPKPSSSQPKAILASAARKLAATSGDLGLLTTRERKAAIELFWLRMEGWVPKVSDIRAWLGWASRDWGSRSGITRAMMSFIRNFDPESDGTRELAAWLPMRARVIAGPFGDFARDYRLHECALAIERIVQELAAGRADFFETLDRDVRCKMVVQGSGLLVAIVGAYGSLCAAGGTVDTETVCRRLLGFLGASGLSGARGSDAMKNHARVTMIGGIVKWTKARGARQTDIDLALEIVLSLAGDPRISRSLWHGVEDGVIEEVEAWLTARTVENMFRVIAELRTDRQDMVEERLAFWRSYLPYIRKAYLLCGRSAETIADRLNERYGSLRGRDSDHCGLLLQIVGPQGDRLTVVDFNKNAKALFWGASSSAAPLFFEPSYDGIAMRENAGSSKRHSPNIWQQQFASEIESETGIRWAPKRGSR